MKFTLPTVLAILAIGAAVTPQQLLGNEQDGTGTSHSLAAPDQPESVYPMQDVEQVIADNCCDCCCRPTWYAQAEVLWLDRETSDTPLVNCNWPGELHMSGNDLGFEMQPGVRLTLGRWCDECTAWELTYLGLQEWNAQAGTGEHVGELSAVPAAGIGNFSDASEMFADYSSELHSAELNYRRWISNTTSVLAGFRYVGVIEDFTLVSFDDPMPPPDEIGVYDVDVDNHMFGFQLGGTWDRPVGDRWTLGVFGKAGLFLNFIQNDITVLEELQTFYTSREEETLAGLIELGAVATYALTDNCRLRAGYNVIYVSGVALGIEQSPSTINTSDAAYHGPSVGIEWRR